MCVHKIVGVLQASTDTAKRKCEAGSPNYRLTRSGAAGMTATGHRETRCRHRNIEYLYPLGYSTRSITRQKLRCCRGGCCCCCCGCPTITTTVSFITSSHHHFYKILDLKKHMTAGGGEETASSDPSALVTAAPPEWNENHAVPPPEVLTLWTQVGDGIDKNQTGM